jgi:hypothetical protein
MPSPAPAFTLASTSTPAPASKYKRSAPTKGTYSLKRNKTALGPLDNSLGGTVGRGRGRDRDRDKDNRE